MNVPRTALSNAALAATRLVRAGAHAGPNGMAGEFRAIAALTPMLLVVAFWNGFPLIYYDTGAYALEGLGGHFLVERSPVYSLFLRFGGAGFSLWTIVALQAVATAFVMVEGARSIVPDIGMGWLLGLCACLVLATGLPWYVGQVEPDCFAAVTVLAIYLLAFRADKMGLSRVCMTVAVGGFAAAAHASHLLLASGLWLCLAIYKAIRIAPKAWAEWPRANLVRPAIMIAMAVSLVLASNYFFTRQIFVSRAGPAFVFGRLLQDRIVTRLLDETCPGSGYRLCAYRDILPPTANAWLWAPYSPFFKLGGFEGTRTESDRIVWDSLARYPMLNVRTAMEDAASQFFSFRTGDQIEPQQWALGAAFARFMSSQVPSYLSARQQKGGIDFRDVNDVHVPVGYISLALLVLCAGYFSWTRQTDAMLLLAMVLLALMGNALICGALSNPHDRYQSRLMWLAPYALILLAIPRISAWRTRRRTAGPAARHRISGHEVRVCLAPANRIRH